ncbi:uncharacterized protein [Diabrotica undecimpunctata]|uniref:uncharacterized protein n=1 Tax=Diabrotica undecimpunctata TaxID=50387 RepID=UPI003B63F6B2
MLEEKLKCWIRAIEEARLKVSRSETEYMWLGGRRMVVDIELLGEKLGEFEYLGIYITENGTLDREIAHSIQANWFNWKRIKGVLCDRKIGQGLKAKINKSVMNPALIYNGKGWPLKKIQENKMEVSELKMLQWMLGKTRRNRIRNDLIRVKAGVTTVSKKN